MKVSRIRILAFVGGFASLAIETIVPRLMASFVGSTAVVWAGCICSAMSGLSLGYYLGSKVREAAVTTAVNRVLMLAGLSCLLVPVEVRYLCGLFSEWSIVGVLLTCLFVLILPSVLLGLLSVLLVSAQGYLAKHPGEYARVGELMALSTVGGVFGALSITLVGVPLIGLSFSVLVIAVLLVGSSVSWTRRVSIMACLGWTLMVPEPIWWQREGEFTLAHEETLYQSVTVFERSSGAERGMRLGPQIDSLYDTRLGTASAAYARTIIGLAESKGSGNWCVVGGAGNAIGLEAARRGACVSIIEIDPIVLELTEEYFGKIVGDKIIADGRVGLEQLAHASQDVIVLDAFSGPGAIPSHMATKEFYGLVASRLSSGGIGVQNVHASELWGKALLSCLVATISSQFAYVRVVAVGPRQSLLVFGREPLPDAVHESSFVAAESGIAASDDRNGIEMLCVYTYYVDRAR